LVFSKIHFFLEKFGLRIAQFEDYLDFLIQGKSGVVSWRDVGGFLFEPLAFFIG